MILRILRGRTGREDLSTLLAAIRGDIEDWAAIDSGLDSAQPAFREAGDDVELLLVSTWQDVESVIAKGGEVTLPRGRVAACGLLRDGRAGHYELVVSARRPDAGPAELVRVSSIPLVPRLSSGFYERVRELWDELVADAGLVAVHVGRRFESDGEQAVAVSVWESAEALAATMSGGFVGGDDVRRFYAGEPAIEHFTALALPDPQPVD